MEESKKIYDRVYFIDVLKIIASIMVVMIHVSVNNIWKYDNNSIEFWAGNIFDAFSRAAVPLFVMISGYFLIDEKKEINMKTLFFHYILKIALIYIFWAFFYSLVYSIIVPLINNNDLTTTEMFKNFLQNFLTGHYHLWYLVMLIGLYLILPILKLWVTKNNLKYVKYFLLIAILAQFLIPSIYDIAIFIFGQNANTVYELYNKMNVQAFLGYSTYFILGWYIKNVDLHRYKKIIYFLGIVACILMITLTYFDVKINGEILSNFYSTLRIYTFVFSFSVFLFFKNLYERKNDKTPKFIKCNREIAKCTFGIYLIHPLILEGITLLFNDVVFNGFVKIPIICIIVYSITLIISYLINKIPIIKKLIS